ncbi:MAG: extracellular solute-binding protein, partial [Lachnospiraceae bacterium]|nr:extracellular solute-binding protein [Lachnospiraceae bacterium]
MKLKKLMAIALSGAMVLSMAACGSSSEGGSASNGESASAANGEESLVVWTLASDLKDFGARYQEKTGVNVETVVIEPADYPTKVQTALMGGETEPDIIVGEPQMLEDFYDNGFFADLDEMGAKDYEGQIVDYVWKVGQDSEGIQRAISYQITPAGIYFRRDIAQEVFGTDDPEEIGKLFADYDTILQTAQTLKDA